MFTTALPLSYLDLLPPKPTGDLSYSLPGWGGVRMGELGECYSAWVWCPWGVWGFISDIITLYTVITV